LNLQPAPGDEQLLYFIQFIAEKYPAESYPARRATNLLPLIAKLAEYKSAGIQFMARSGLPMMNGPDSKNIWKPRRLFESGSQN